MFRRSTEADDRLRKFNLYNAEHIGRGSTFRPRPTAADMRAIVFLVFVATGIGLGVGWCVDTWITGTNAARLEAGE